MKDPPDAGQVAAVVSALRGGALAVLPTETVYGVAADAGNPAATEQLAAFKGRDPKKPFTHHFASARTALGRFAQGAPDRVNRFLERAWPGPVTAILPQAEGSGDRLGAVGLRVPSHPFTQAVLADFPDGVLMTSVNRAGEPPANDPDAIVRRFADDDRVAVLAAAGPPRLGEASAVVRFVGRKMEVLRQGLLTRDELWIAAAAKILFVCTGNTCRSPLAEVLARKHVAEQLDIPVDQILAHGFHFVSAGTGTLPGMPASGGAVEAAKEVGLDLSSHRSNLVTPELVAACDRIYCLSNSHREDVIHLVPSAEEKTFLLDPKDESVADPFGGPIEVYRRTSAEIDEHVRARVPEWLAL